MDCVKIEHREGIEIRTIKDGKKFSRIYTKRGKVLPRIILEGHYIEQLKAFRSLDKDLRNILLWIKKLVELHEKNDYAIARHPDMDAGDAAILKALFVAVLVTYGRCFTSAKNRKFTFDRKHVPSEFHEIHDEIIDARHNFAAHKGDFEYEDCQIALVVKNEKKDFETIFFSELMQPYVSEELVQDDSKIASLCEALRTVVNQKYKALTDKIFEECIVAKGKHFWLKANGTSVNINANLNKK